jgi:hypothetical protein
MNFALAQSMIHRPRVLRGGKAPLYWKRQLSSLTEVLGSTPRKCDWIKDIADTHPRLLSAPLLGTCLTAVTSPRSPGVARSDNHAESPANHSWSTPVAGNQGKETTSERMASSKRQQIRSPAFADQKSDNPRRLEMASQLPRRASDSLLQRAAPDALHATENLIGIASSPPRARPGSPSVNASLKVTRSEWLHLVADRAAQKWISGWVFPSTRKSLSPAVPGNRSKKSHASAAGARAQALDAPASASSTTIETIILPALHDDWLLPIGGKQASPQLLASLVKRPISPVAGNIHRNKETFTAINSDSRRPPSSPDLLATEQRVLTNGPDISRPLDRMFDRQTPALPADGDRSFSLQPVLNSEEREQDASPNFAPTALTPALLPLLPPASAGAPVLPVAADTARRIAWRDEVAAHETDLSVLAAQVKRILDEEARRHGIDV